MKSLHTLIRLQKQKVDALKRSAGEIENKKQQLLGHSKQLADDLKAELILAASTPEMSGFFGDFAERIRGKRAQIAGEVLKLDKKLDELAEQIRLAFGELKKFELVRDRRIAEQKAKEAKRENEQLDETAIMQHARKK